MKAALAVATHFAHAIEAKRAQRAARGQTDLLYYNVFVLCASPDDIAKEMPHVVSRMVDEVVYDGDAKAVDAPEEQHRAHTKGTDALTVSETHVVDPRSGAQHPSLPPQDTPATPSSSAPAVLKANTISFAQREKDEMRELTQASEIVTFPLDDAEPVLKAFNASSTQGKWDPQRGQVFLGNANDVPVTTGASSPRRGSAAEWDFSTNDPGKGLGYDVCIECDDMAPFPSQAHMRAAEEHVARLERKWMDRCLREFDARVGREGEGSVDADAEVPVRPPPPANLVVHLPFPSSVAYSGNSIPPFVSWLETLLKPVAEGKVTYRMLKERERVEGLGRRWSGGANNGKPVARRSTNAATIGHAYGGGYHQHGGSFGHAQQFGGPSSLPPPSAFPPSFLPTQGTQPQSSTYTRMRSTSATHLISPPSSSSSSSSTTPPPVVQVPPRTRPIKILVYSADGYTESSSLALCMLMALKKLSLPEAYLELQIEKRRSFFVYPTEVAPMKRVEARLERDRVLAAPPSQTRHGRPPAMSMSFAAGSVHGGASFFGPDGFGSTSGVVGRPRANTLPPPLANLGGHYVWFNDPRFDGSFPSRVLPFLYLGNL